MPPTAWGSLPPWGEGLQQLRHILYLHFGCLQDYSMRVLNVALNPPRLGRQTAPSPTKVYKEADYMQWIPTTGTASRQYTFVSNFVGTTMMPATNLSEFS